MREQDSDDVFLRHSTAVLDAMLGGSDDLDDDRPDDGLDFDGPPAVSAPGVERPAGPRASDAIAALLNGGSPGGGGGFSGYTGPMPEITSAVPEAIGTEAAAPRPPHAEDVPGLLRPGSRGPLDDMRRLVARQPRRRLILIGGVAAAILLVIVIATSGGSKSSAPVMMATKPAPMGAPPATPTAPAENQIQVKSATSQCPAGSTSAMDAFDGQDGKAWDCVRAYGVDGQVLTINLGGTQTVDSIGIVPGWDHVESDGTDEWTKHRTASRVSYEFNDSNQTTYTQQTMNQRTEVVTKISPPVTASQVTVTILESAGDKSLNDTAISSIVITGSS
jgi:hypothetical protein